MAAIGGEAAYPCRRVASVDVVSVQSWPAAFQARLSTTRGRPIFRDSPIQPCPCITYTPYGTPAVTLLPPVFFFPRWSQLQSLRAPLRVCNQSIIHMGSSSCVLLLLLLLLALKIPYSSVNSIPLLQGLPLHEHDAAASSFSFPY